MTKKGVFVRLAFSFVWVLWSGVTLLFLRVVEGLKNEKKIPNDSKIKIQIFSFVQQF